MRTRVSPCCTVATAASIVWCGLVNWSAFPEPRAAAAKAPDTLHPGSGAYPIIHAAFRDGGWSASEASIHAKNAMARLGVAGFEIQVAPGSPAAPHDDDVDVLHPASGAYEIVHAAFRHGGWSGEDASTHAKACLVRAGYKELGDVDIECEVYLGVFRWCDGQDIKILRRSLRKGCFDALFQGQDPCDLPNCVSGQVPWYNITLAAGCNLGHSGCVHMQIEKQDTLPCDNPDLIGCDCFVETDCDDIELECCDRYGPNQGGCDYPTNCPDCD